MDLFLVCLYVSDNDLLRRREVDTRIGDRPLFERPYAEWEHFIYFPVLVSCPVQKQNFTGNKHMP